jgi:branched-chain amino acid transport system substrate-binding protein
MGVAYTMVKTLQKAGKNLTRKKLVDAANHLNMSNPFLLPKVRITTSSKDHFPISQLQLARYNGTTFVGFGPLVNGRK